MMDERESCSHEGMLSVCLADLSADLRQAIRRFYASLPAALHEEFAYLLARAEAESAELADTTWAAAMERVLAQSRLALAGHGLTDGRCN
jgi:hypothetical protein